LKLATSVATSAATSAAAFSVAEGNFEISSSKYSTQYVISKFPSAIPHGLVKLCSMSLRL